MSVFSKLSKEEQEWFDGYLNGSLDEVTFSEFQDRLANSSKLRAALRRYLALDDHLQRLSERGSDSVTAPWLEIVDTPPQKWLPLAVAAGLAFLAGVGFMFFQETGSNAEVSRGTTVEPSSMGFAVVENLFDATWLSGAESHREGDALGSETFALSSGTAEIRFFSGATMTVQGPAEIVLKSAWEADCRMGTVRMQVPPAARGFKLNAPKTEIIDLGTEFGLEVRDGTVHTEVFDGEIAIRHQNDARQLIKKGAAWELPDHGPATQIEPGRIAFPNIKQLGSKAIEQRLSDFTRWQSHRDLLARDPRLISYYTFHRENQNALIPNITELQNPDRDGAIVLAESVDGRWPGLKSALEFRRPGSRVRVNIQGEFPAFTFMCWVRIDSLDRWYNALFMVDGYETGEPHWQIRDDGKLMLSVMVDDSGGKKALIHRNYYSPSFWDISMSGQWVHLASVFDPENRTVSHFVNGERIHSEDIVDKYFIDTLRIGNAEIGNWGQPLRETPRFAIRNLNGRMDELAIFKVALNEDEIRNIYKRSRARTR